LWLLPQLSDDVTVPQVVPRVSFGIILDPGTVLRDDPQARYDELHGHQYLTITFFGATKASTASLVLDHAKRCSPNFDIVHELQGAVPIRLANAPKTVWRGFQAVEFLINKEGNSTMTCELTTGVWPASRTEHKLPFSLLGPFTHIDVAAGRSGARYVDEVRFGFDTMHGQFNNLEYEGGRALPVHRPAGENVEPEVDPGIRYLTTGKPFAPSLMASWHDGGAATRRDYVILFLGALVALAATILYELAGRLIERGPEREDHNLRIDQGAASHGICRGPGHVFSLETLDGPNSSAVGESQK
jgi:hypothetical protein